MVKILVADDIADIRFAYEAILCSEGHAVVSAKDGAEAARFLKAERFDLVVTDLMMPNQDGVELATTLSKDPDRPKILAITGGGSRITASQALQISEHFFDAALEKPVNRETLIATVNDLLSAPLKK